MNKFNMISLTKKIKIIIDIIVLVFGFLYWFLSYQIEIFWQYLVFFITSNLIKLNCGVNDILNVINFINNLFHY